MQTIETNAKGLELTGGETQAHFKAGYPFFWVRNDSPDTIRISLSPNISDGKDGVISIPAGSSNGTMHSYRLNDLYISGRGKVMVMGTESAHNPFKPAAKGGDKGFSGNYNDLTNKPYIPVPSEVINANSTNETVSTSKSVFDYVISMLASAGFKPVKVNELPEVGSDRILYLLPKDDLLSGNFYDEYLWIDNTYELVGTTDVDLSNYATKTEVASKQDIITKPPITDNSADWNTLTETAIYPIGIEGGFWDSSTHGLSNAYPYGFLAAMATKVYGWVYQLYINDRSEIYMRTRYNSWSSWTRIDAGAIDLSGYGRPISDPTLDWNTLTSNGIYTIGYNGLIQEESHGPVRVSGWGVLTVTNTGLGQNQTACILQKYESLESGIYYRSLWNSSGNWSPWYKISGTTMTN